MAQAFPDRMLVDAARKQGELRPDWRFFGCDKPNYAYVRDGRKLLAYLGRLGPATAFFGPRTS